MASQKVNTNYPLGNNDGGVVLQGGGVSENLTDLSLIRNSIVSGVPGYGTTVTLDTAVAPFDYTDPHGVIKAKSTGTFAYTPAPGTNFLITGGGDNASSINGTATPSLSGILAIPGGAVGQVINKNLKSQQGGTYATRTFNVLATPSSGNFPGLTRGTSAGTDVNYPSTSGNYTGIDDEASTTRTLPGELTYMFGSVIPTRNQSYKSKDSAESGVS